MSSTYSPDLRIELPANGEQSGVWGNTTNNNLGTLIEQSIAAAASVNIISTDQALTAFYGVSDEARCAAINLATNSTGSTFNVYVPPVPKLYVFINSTAQAAKLYVSSVLGNTTPAVGVGTYYALAAGATAYVRVTGTIIVDAINSLNTLAVSGTATGTTPSVGDSSTKFATTAFVSSAVSGGFPSGAVVMWSTATAPSGWLICNGASLSTTTYAALFAVIGYTFGGSGASFSLPDYRDRMPLGVNTIAASIGATGGSKDATLVSHNHTASSSVSDPGHSHSLTNGTNVLRSGSPRNKADGSSADLNVATLSIASAITGITVSTSISTEGSSATNANMTPYLGINFIIKT